MKVVFLKPVPPHRVGQVANVADGYAQNFLFPRKLAQAATPKALQLLNDKQRTEAAGAAQKHQAVEQLVARLSGATIPMVAKAAPSGTLYAAITAQAIRAAVEKALDCHVPEDVGNDVEHIKSTGKHVVTWKLDGQLVTFTVDI